MLKRIALSVDPADQHINWIKDIEETQKTARLVFPIIADADKKVSGLYDMRIHPNQSATATVRSLFVIDPKRK
jgi:alkyl hydroperoxide reductase subunit AhpC